LILLTILKCTRNDWSKFLSYFQFLVRLSYLLFIMKNSNIKQINILTFIWLAAAIIKWFPTISIPWFFTHFVPSFYTVDLKVVDFLNIYLFFFRKSKFWFCSSKCQSWNGLAWICKWINLWGFFCTIFVCWINDMVDAFG